MSSNKSVKMTEDEISKALAKAEKEAEKKDHKKIWMDKMMKSAKTYYKLCPYYDKKTSSCFLSTSNRGNREKCNREGRYENCPIFLGFLDEKYQDYTSKKKILPLDFLDLQSM
ncbi:MULTISPECIES: hypothetical protein [Acidianus]|uniref:Uncharacterized protein n=1 Tax=Candidatus Acidianus copahuensis TaxID=1160895 RepID=A0A031LMF9_9CREN|nr:MULTISPECIES: hypothetical protein [Acidianus]EZQ06823.1 hypothetical protein CM19_05475 [Candidatus Acidianus copahuensis]NON61500.1 hypothetical protein [Acidianus sp. RZ1]